MLVFSHICIVFNNEFACDSIRMWEKRVLISLSNMFLKLFTFELWASSTLTLLNSRSNRSCCFRYRSASAKLLLLPCNLCRNPPKAFSSISCDRIKSVMHLIRFLYFDIRTIRVIFQFIITSKHMIRFNFKRIMIHRFF